MVQAVQTVQCV